MASTRPRFDDDRVPRQPRAPAEVEVLGEGAHARVPSPQVAKHCVAHEHARRRHEEDLAGGIVLPEIDLVPLQSLVWVAEAVDGHAHLF
jgi:hypothetical protein